MPRKAGIIFLVLGAVLMLSALFLFFYNKYDEYHAGQEAELLLDDIQSAIAGKQAPAVPGTEDIAFEDAACGDIDSKDIASEDTASENISSEEALPAEMPVLLINGYEYIGYLSISDLGLELPVMAEWDYRRLKVAPCRQSGSTRTDDLVIAAHNYKTHFGKLSGLEVGAAVGFTDMEGIESKYTLEKLETLSPDAVDAVLNSGYDLVLYTCTPGGRTRVAAFCNRAADGLGGDADE